MAAFASSEGQFPTLNGHQAGRIDRQVMVPKQPSMIDEGADISGMP
jgi:hypothetical protein